MLEFWRDDGQSVNDIAARLSLPGHALSLLLARMDRAGLLTRTRQAPDRRVVWVRLTSAGATAKMWCCSTSSFRPAAHRTPA